MKKKESGYILRIYISEDEKYDHQPLCEVIVKKSQELNLAGATVLRGILGFGADSRIHSAKFLRLNQDLPVVVEIVDKKENIDKIIPFLNETVRSGLVTLEEIKILKYGQ